MRKKEWTEIAPGPDVVEVGPDGRERPAPLEEEDAELVAEIERQIREEKEKEKEA